MTDKPPLVLVAGPHRSGTGGDPRAMAADPAHLERAARTVFEAGHLPVIGERIALPVHHDVAEIPRRAPRETA
ncbi:hypothetical protein AB0E83_12535 [Streptomyces sp. NPDC035033]|uniref:hypothetical protein n=1 Tax=Streptomyces sp. NPDC035033 TaxID=3155368 RepID=UPI0033E318F1